MEINYDQLEIVLLRSPYHTIHEDFTQTMWGKLMAMKVRGYQAEYPFGILPFDTSDIVATHLIVCMKERSSLNPMFAFKSVTLDKCDRHRIPFPMLSMSDGKGQAKHMEVISKLLKSHRDSNTAHLMAYNGSFTADPAARKYSNFKDVLWNLTLTLLVNYYTDYEIPNVIAVSSTQFKVDKRKIKWGWKYLQHNQEVLPSFPCYPLFDREFSAMTLNINDHTDFALEVAKKYQSVWNRRLVIDETTEEMDQGKVLPLASAS